MDLQEVRERGGAVLDEVERAIVGKRDALELILAAVLCDGHVLLEDYPGLAKILDAADRSGPKPSAEEMDDLIRRREMAPLFA